MQGVCLSGATQITRFQDKQRVLPPTAGLSAFSLEIAHIIGVSPLLFQRVTSGAASRHLRSNGCKKLSCLQIEWPTHPTTQGGRGIRLPKRMKNRTTGKPASAGQVARRRAVQSRKYRAVAGAIFCIRRCGRHSVPMRSAELPAGDNQLSPLFPHLGKLWRSQCVCHPDKRV